MRGLGILFFIVWGVLVFPSLGSSALVIYADGHRYASWQEYAKMRAFKDFSKLQVTDTHTWADRLDFLSVEYGLRSALGGFKGFDAPHAQAVISRQALGMWIRQALRVSKAPKLLIVERGKLRIMALSPEDSKVL